MKTRRAALLWTTPPLLLVAGLALVMARTPALAAPPDAAASAALADPQPARTSAPPTDEPRAMGLQAQARVERAVAERNGAARAETASFAREGWTLVDAPPPDAQLLALSPALLRGHEQELRLQIASNTAAPSQIDNLAAIAGQASPQTQAAAIESLGRISGPGAEPAQRALTRLLLELPPSSAARREIAPLLRPASLDGAQAAQLARLLDDPALLPAEREQLAFTLALIGLRDASALPAEVLNSLSPQARALLARFSALARLDSIPRPQNDGEAQ